MRIQLVGKRGCWEVWQHEADNTDLEGSLVKKFDFKGTDQYELLGFNSIEYMDAFEAGLELAAEKNCKLTRKQYGSSEITIIDYSEQG